MPRLQSPGHARRFLAAYGLAELQEVPRTGRPRHFAPAARGAVMSSATGTPVDAPARPCGEAAMISPPRSASRRRRLSCAHRLSGGCWTPPLSNRIGLLNRVWFCA